MKNLFSLTLCLSLLSSNTSVDQYLSPYVGADLIESTTEGLISFEDALKPEADGTVQQIGAGVYRIGTLLFFWGPLGFLENLIQHEVFGHGYRVRSFKKWQYEVVGYSFFSDSSTVYTEFLYPQKTNQVLYNTIVSGGTEAQTLLAMHLRESFFEKGFQDGRWTLTYNMANLGLANYIQDYARLKNEKKSAPEGHDIDQYLITINQLNPQNPVSIKQLESMATLTLLDPFLWNQIVSFWTYALFGKELPTPVMTWNTFRFVPSLSPNLTPFGPEIIFEQYYSIGTTPFKTYFRYTPFNKRGNYGAGYKNHYIWNLSDLHIGAQVDVWVAPKLAPLGQDQPPFTKESRLRPGISGLITFRQTVGSFERFKAGLDLGYKTQGYLIGAPVQKGVVGSVSATFEF